MNENTGNDQKAKVKSLQKAIGVLNCFLVKQSLSLTEISEMMDIYKSNAHNILSTLVSLDYLEKNEKTGKYSLGIGIYRLSRVMDDKRAFAKIADPIIKELSNEVGEAVVLCVPRDGDVLYVAGEIPTVLGFRGKPYFVGSTSKMHCTSSGKAMLAFMDEAEREQILPEELEALTEFTITDKAILNREFELIRQRGYATDHMECVIGLSCIAYPIIDMTGKPICSLTITGPSARIEGDNSNFLIKTLIKYGQKLTEILNGE